MDVVRVFISTDSVRSRYHILRLRASLHRACGRKGADPLHLDRRGAHADDRSTRSKSWCLSGRFASARAGGRQGSGSSIVAKQWRHPRQTAAQGLLRSSLSGKRSNRRGDSDQTGYGPSTIRCTGSSRCGIPQGCTSRRTGKPRTWHNRGEEVIRGELFRRHLSGTVNRSKRSVPSGEKREREDVGALASAHPRGKERRRAEQPPHLSAALGVRSRHRGHDFRRDLESWAAPARPIVETDNKDAAMQAQAIASAWPGSLRKLRPHPSGWLQRAQLDISPRPTRPYVAPFARFRLRYCYPCTCPDKISQQSHSYTPAENPLIQSPSPCACPSTLLDFVNGVLKTAWTEHDKCGRANKLGTGYK